MHATRGAEGTSSTERTVRGRLPARHTPGNRTPGEIVVIVALVLLAVLLVSAIVTAARRLYDGRPLLGGPGGRVDSPGHVATGDLGGAHDGEFEVVGQATTVTVRTDTKTHGYRVSTPDDAGVVPRVVRSGTRVQLYLTPAAEHPGAGPAAVEVRLDRAVRWHVRLTGGATEDTLDLGAGRVSAVDLAGGVTHAELTLPRPDGTVPVRLSGGAGQLYLHLPPGVPAQVTAGSGAGTVLVDGTTHAGVGAGTVLTPPDWSTATDRYDVQALAGVSVLTVDRH